METIWTVNNDIIMVYDIKLTDILKWEYKSGIQ